MALVAQTSTSLPALGRKHALNACSAIPFRSSVVHQRDVLAGERAGERRGCGTQGKEQVQLARRRPAATGAEGSARGRGP